MLEYGIAGNGMPMGKAEIGGGSVKADGFLYQFVGSVPTYNDLLDLDTTNFEPGYVYDVQEDGMDYAWTGTEWNTLGPRIDLSGYYRKEETYSKSEVNTRLDAKADETDLANYYPKDETYNKAEVDSLIPDVSTLATKTELTDGLAGKQDALEIDTPLAMNTISYASNMVNDGDAVYAQTANGYIIPYENMIYAPSSSSPTTLDDIFATGYIDVPLTGGDTVTCNDDYRNATLGCVLGEGFGSDFKPLITFRGDYTGTNSLGMCDGTYTLSSGRATLNLTATLTNGSMEGWTDDTSKINAFQIIKGSNNYTVNIRWRYGESRVGLLSYTISDTTQKAILDRVNCCRVFPLSNAGQTSSAPLSAAKFGVYNVGSDINNTTVFSNNIISVSDLINGSEHLQLNIGNGLTVNNGALETDGVVESSDITNIIALTQAEYDALATKDPNTLYTITDASTIDDELYYKAGDTFSADGVLYVPGNSYNNKEGFVATLILPKRITNISSISWVSDSSYVYQESSRYLIDTTATNLNISLLKAGHNYLNIRVLTNDSSEMLPSGRANVILGFRGTLTFS